MSYCQKKYLITDYYYCDKVTDNYF